MEPSKLNQVSTIDDMYRYTHKTKILNVDRIYVDISRYFSIDIELPYVPVQTVHISTYVTVWLYQYHSSQVYSGVRLIYWNPASHLVISIPVMISDDGIDCNDILMVAGVTSPR